VNLVVKVVSFVKLCVTYFIAKMANIRKTKFEKYKITNNSNQQPKSSNVTTQTTVCTHFCKLAALLCLYVRERGAGLGTRSCGSAALRSRACTVFVRQGAWRGAGHTVLWVGGAARKGVYHHHHHGHDHDHHETVHQHDHYLRSSRALRIKIRVQRGRGRGGDVEHVGQQLAQAQARALAADVLDAAAAVPPADDICRIENMVPDAVQGGRLQTDGNGAQE
jgi:hypothetical protein